MSAQHLDESPRFAELNAEYEIVRELGRGGATVVYLARERELSREVAIKVAAREDEQATARLLSEARTMAGLRHPSIVTLYGTRRLRDGSLALIMQHIRGRTLRTEIQQRGALPVADVEGILTDLANALAYLQSHGVEHRAIDSGNVVLDEETGRACLADFSNARRWNDQALTPPGTATGTPAELPPEQLEDATLDACSDIHSLGVVAHEMLTGYGDLHPLTELRRGIPPRLRYIVERMVRENPAERWASAADVAAALNHGPRIGPWDPDKTQASVMLARAEMDVPPAEGDTIGDRALDGDRPQTPSVVPRPEPADDDDFPLFLAPPRTGPERRGRLRKMVAAYLLMVVLVGTTALAVLGSGDDRRTASAQGSRQSPALRVGAAAPVAAGPRPTLSKAAAGDALPAVIFPIFGSTQSGIAGDTLATPVVVRVEDAAGRTVSGTTVAFHITAGRGKVEPATAVSDEHGLATVRWLPQEPGSHLLEAVVPGGEIEPVTFRARITARPAVRLTSSLTADRGGGGSGATPVILVRAEDDRGQPVAGAEVRFVVSTGGGRIEPASARTGRDGTARVKWTLGAGSTQEAIAALPDRQDQGILIRAGGASRLAVREGVTVGGTHTCLLQAAGEVWCWGGNESGQSGSGSVSRQLSRGRVALPEPIAELSAGGSHTCGVSVSGNVFCWGANDAGQLGDGTQVARAGPVRVGGDRPFTTIFTGAEHTCALDARGRLYCWGRNTHGQLGDGTRTNRSEPVRAGGNQAFVSVSVGWAHTCALSDGRAFCWGRNTSGELGDGSTTDRSAPAAVAGAHTFIAIAAGNTHTCGLSGRGTILCWGQNASGQLGTGDRGASLVPVPVAVSETFAHVTAGSVHSCGVTRRGEAFCWGRNTYGQLGDGSTVDRPRPVAVEGGLRFTSLEAKGAHTCGVAAGGGTGYCWGFNLSGQLGDGTRSNRTRPMIAGNPR